MIFLFSFFLNIKCTRIRELLQFAKIIQISKNAKQKQRKKSFFALFIDEMHLLGPSFYQNDS
jgi:hypothetical protein